MTTTPPPAQQHGHPPVLILVPGAYGAPDGAAPTAPADPAAAQLPVTDFVVTRGDGVFETIGVFDGRPVNVGPHLARLVRSLAMIDMPAPDLDVLAAAIDEAIAAHAPVPELTVRLSVSRGPEGEDAPRAWIHARTADDYDPQRRGIAVVALDRGLLTTVRATSPWLLAGAKTLSYAVNMAAFREARRRGADDVLFVAADGYALEGPTSTLLLRQGDRFLTTPPEAGVLPGTSVALVFETLAAEGFEVAEELVTPEQVANGDGAWLLSSSRLAAPIARLDDTELPVDTALTERLEAVLKGQG